MRRSAQFQIEGGVRKVLSESVVNSALEEMLFTGGALNRRLLGDEQVETQGA
jgi:hypothetical protein